MVLSCCALATESVRRVMIAVPGGQDYPRGTHTTQDIIGSDRQTNEAPGSVTPGARLSIPPATVPEVEDPLPMRTGANLAPPLRALEADHSRELRPVDGIEEAMLTPDWHARQSRCAAAAAAAWLRVRA